MFRSASILTALSVCSLLAPSPTASAETVVASSTLQFSNVQGQDGWSYGIWDADLDGYQPSEFTEFPASSWVDLPAPELGAWWTPPFFAAPWTIIFANRQHSETSPTVWTIRRWQSSVSGPVRISGSLAKHVDGLGGDGVRAVIYVDGVQVFEQAVSPKDNLGYDYSFETSLVAGSVVDFALDPLATDALDTTVYTAEITDLTPDGPSYGDGCPGSAGFVPQLTISGKGKPGKVVRMTITGGHGGSTGVVYLGAFKANLPIGYGCTLNVTPLHPFVLGPFMLTGGGPGNGKFSANLGIPASMPPVTFTMQAFLSDPNAPGFSNSNGWELVITN